MSEREASTQKTYNMFSLFDTLMDATIVINGKAVIQYMNKASEKVTGYKARELVGRNVNLLMTDDIRFLLNRMMRSAIFVFSFCVSPFVMNPKNIFFHTLNRNFHNSYVKNYIKTGVARIIGTGRDVVVQRKVTWTSWMFLLLTW